MNQNRDAEPATSTQAEEPQSLRRLSPSALVVVVFGVLAVTALLSHTAFAFDRTRVDESEVLHFAVSMLSGDLDPGWYGYGSLNMYIMLIIYWLLYLPMRAVGAVTGIEDYARELFRSDLFFQVGRYVYALYGTATVALVLVASWRRQIGWGWLAAFGAVTLTSPHLLTFANYVRTDTLLGLVAVALGVVAARRRIGLGTLLLAGGLAAAAVSVKFSGALLVVVPVGLAVIGLRRGTLRVRDVVAAAALTVCLTLLFSPYATPIDVAQDVFDRRIANDAFRYGAPTFLGVGARLARIFEQLGAAVGTPLVALAPLAVTAPRRLRRLAAAFAVVLVLLLLPFLVSSDLPGYWFIPSAAVTRGLALLGLVGVGERVVRALQEHPAFRARARWRYPWTAVAGVAALLVAAGSVVVPQIRDGLVPAYELRIEPSNLELARRFLEENRTSCRPILMNGPYLQSTPEVYDPSQVNDAKRISRAFIFNRWGDPFLNRVFIGWLNEEYGPNTGTVPADHQSIQRVRYQVSAAPSEVVELSLVACVEEACSPIELVEVQGARPGDGTGEYLLDSLDDDRTLIGTLETDILADGATDVVAEVRGTRARGSLHLGTGDDFPSPGRVLVDGDSTTRAIAYLPVPEGKVVELDLNTAAHETDDVRSLVAEPSWFVTSPAIYERFLNADVEALPDHRRENARRLGAMFEELLAQPEIVTFDDGRGPPVEIVELLPR